LPPLKTKIDTIEKYDLVFIGFPTWDMKISPPMKSFLHQYDLSGKTVIPFNTNAGYGVGSGFQTIRELCPDSKVLEGFSITGGRSKGGRNGSKKMATENKSDRMMPTQNRLKFSRRIWCDFHLET
jgi:multimeric flavodoxin WrbA